MSELYHTSGENASGNCEEKPGYYAIIPADVRYNEQLPPNAKLLYGEITALTTQQGYCYATNDYFCRLYGFSDPTITRLLKSLEDNGFIRREVIRDQTGKVASRKIWLCVSTYSAQPPINFEGTLPSKLMGPPIKIDGENNTYEYSLPNASAREEPAKPQRHTLTDAQMDEAIRQCVGTLAKTNHWSDSEREAVCKLVQEFYSPRAMNGKPPKHTTRGINGLFRKLAPNGRCSAKAAGEMLNEAIERGWTSVYPHEDRGRAPARAAAAPSVHLGAEL